MPQRILLVEDETMIQEMYALALKRKGYEVEAASDGEEGLNKLMAEGSRYDLVLLDIMMPKLDGISILRKLKESDKPVKNTPVIMLTNLGLDDVVNEAKSLGVFKVLIKSSTLPNQILEEVAQFFASTSPGSTPVQGAPASQPTPVANPTPVTAIQPAPPADPIVANPN